MAYQLTGYLMLKFDSFVNDWNHNYIFNVPLHFLKVYFLFCLKWFICSYNHSYLIQVIFTQKYGFKSLFPLNNNIFAHSSKWLHGVVPNMLDCYIMVSKFEF